MRRRIRFLTQLGEPLLWVCFFASAFVSLIDHVVVNGPTICGLFALAAIGVRATRPELVIPRDVDHVS